MAIQDKVIEHRVLLEYQKNRIINKTIIELMLMLPEMDSFVKFLIKNNVTKMTKDQEKSFLNIIEQSYKATGNESANLSYDLSKYETVFNRSLVADLTIANIARPQLLKADYLDIYRNTNLLGGTFATRMTTENDYTSQLLKSAINQGLEKGVGYREIAQSIRNKMESPKARLDNLVRTNVVNTMAEANMVLFTENQDIIKAYQWCAILDPRTTDLCRSRNGKTWTMAQIKEKGYKIPAHWNCRSFWMPVFYASEVVQDGQYDDYQKWQKEQRSSKVHLISDTEDGFIINKTKEMSLEKMKEIDNGN